MIISMLEAKVCTERKIEIGWVSFPAKTPPIRKHRKKRSKLDLPRLAGGGEEVASIEGHHMQCSELLKRMKSTFGEEVRRKIFVSCQVNIEMAGASGKAPLILSFTS